MAVCAAIKADGERCKATATPGQQWCYAHDPAQAEQRKRNASKGGKTAGNGRPSTSAAEIQKIKDWLRALASGVLNDKVEIGKAYAINALLGTQLRAIELERKIKETEELEQRIAELELAQEAKDKRWHA